MGLLNLTESERREILNLHNNAKIIKELAAAPAAAAPADDKSKIMAIQTALNSKYNSNLKVDGILGQNTITALYGAMKSKSAAPAAAGTTPPASGATGTATAATTPAEPIRSNPFNAADMKPATGTAAPAATTTAAPATGTAAPAATTTAAPATGTAAPATAPVVDAGSTDFTDGGNAQPQTPRDQRRARQDLRRGNRRAMQDLRAGQRSQ